MFHISYQRGGGLRFITVERGLSLCLCVTRSIPGWSAESRAVADPDEIELPAWVQPGAQFRMLNQHWQVRAIVDGGAVCRAWRPSKKRWRYEWIDPKAFIGSPRIEPV
jgi:hypothetical protein